ncbi:MAG: hypothetical protein KDD52_05050 [Bdellovibrionales bacterium]|nr:hypothetical protein [Bdellovibrionales bacterium]
MHEKTDHALFFSLATFFALSVAYLCYLWIPQSYWIEQHYGLSGLNPEVPIEEIETRIQTQALHLIKKKHPSFSSDHLICQKSPSGPTASCKAMAKSYNIRRALESVFTTQLVLTLGMIDRSQVEERVRELDRLIEEQSQKLLESESTLSSLNIDYFESEEQFDQKKRRLEDVEKNILLRKKEIKITEAINNIETSSENLQIKKQAQDKIKHLEEWTEKTRPAFLQLEKDLERYSEVESAVAEFESSLNHMESELFQWKNVLGQESKNNFADFREFQLKALSATLELQKNRNPFYMIWAFPLGFLLFYAVSGFLIPILDGAGGLKPSQEETVVEEN